MSYNASINASEKGQQWQRALQLMGAMQVRSVQPSVNSPSAAMSACQKGRQWQRALQLMEVMQSCSVEPDVISYGAAISVCEKCQQWRLALQLMEAMQSRSVEPDVIIHCCHQRLRTGPAMAAGPAADGGDAGALRGAQRDHLQCRHQRL